MRTARRYSVCSRKPSLWLGILTAACRTGGSQGRGGNAAFDLSPLTRRETRESDAPVPSPAGPEPALPRSGSCVIANCVQSPHTSTLQNHSPPAWLRRHFSLFDPASDLTDLYAHQSRRQLRSDSGQWSEELALGPRRHGPIVTWQFVGGCCYQGYERLVWQQPMEASELCG